MAGRIDTAFARAKAENRGSLGVFITAGDPDATTTEPCLTGWLVLVSILLSLACLFPTQWPMAPPFRQHHSGVKRWHDLNSNARNCA